MGNYLGEKVITGTIGELLVQLRLLEYGIQAAPPIKDSGNDLIAIRGRIVKFIQVKSSKTTKIGSRNLPEIYDIVMLVYLKFSQDNQLLLDETRIFFYKKGQTSRDRIELTKEAVDLLWQD